MFSRKSLSREITESCQPTPLPGKIRFIPESFPAIFPSSFTDIWLARRESRMLRLGPCFVDRWGNIVRRGVLHRSSWNFDRQTWRDALRHGYRWTRAKSKAESLKTAVVLSYHMIFDGTFGDYWVEVLTSLCVHRPAEGSVILFPSARGLGLLEQELSELNYRGHVIGEQGAWVDDTMLLEPPHAYGNFSRYSAGRIVEAFPQRRRSPKPESGTAVYLSRRGFQRDRRWRRGDRSFKNSEAIENMLRGGGFEILHPHLSNNPEIARKLAEAEVVVADHGGALFNIAWARPKLLVELVSPHWWMPCFVKLTAQLSVDRHLVLAADSEDNIPIDQLRSLVLGSQSASAG
jgi:hypothetical protein